MLSEARISLECAIGDSITVGRKRRPLAASAQTTSSSSALPDKISSRPAFTFGLINLVKDGFRRSASIKMVLAPACAQSRPRAAAVVDFPSLGSAEENPTIRPVRLELL